MHKEAGKTYYSFCSAKEMAECSGDANNLFSKMSAHYFGAGAKTKAKRILVALKKEEYISQEGQLPDPTSRLICIVIAQRRRHVTSNSVFTHAPHPRNYFIWTLY